jgi:hypothetical protein
MLASRLTTFTLSLGVLGGAALTVSAAFLTPGKNILIPYMLFITTTAILLRTGPGLPFRSAFFVGLGSFVLASGILYAYTAIVANSSVSVLGHLWRLALVVLMGAAINLAVAQVSAHSEPSTADSHPA